MFQPQSVPKWVSTLYNIVSSLAFLLFFVLIFSELLHWYPLPQLTRGYLLLALVLSSAVTALGGLVNSVWVRQLWQRHLLKFASISPSVEDAVVLFISYRLWSNALGFCFFVLTATWAEARLLGHSATGLCCVTLFFFISFDVVAILSIRQKTVATGKVNEIRKRNNQQSEI